MAEEVLFIYSICVNPVKAIVNFFADCVLLLPIILYAMGNMGVFFLMHTKFSE